MVGGPAESPPGDDRLDSWKEIATYLERDVRTVQLWERHEGLPVHRHEHKRRGTVYASKPEIDAWWGSRTVAPEAKKQVQKVRRRWLIPAGVLIVAGAVWFGLLQKPRPQASEFKLVPLTSYPGKEMWPSFSPDGNQVAFAWQPDGREDFDIYVKVVGAEKTLQLTNTSDWDICPAWSPDGREIAFNRSGRQGGNAIYVVSPLGGPERMVADLGGMGYAFWWPTPNYPRSSLSWSPDGKWLAYGGIWLLSVDTGEKRRLTSPPAGFAGDATPAFSPDGQSVAFVRRKSAQVDDVYVISVTGGEPKRLTTDEREIFGLCWTTDGREVIFSSNRSGGPSLLRVPVSEGGPRHVAETGEYAWFPSISRQGRRLAFTRQLSDLNIWRIAVPGVHQDKKQSARLIASTKAERNPQFSPDGKRVGFTSDRSGTMQVWVCDEDGSNTFQLTSFPRGGAQLSAWSPDGRSIAFNSAIRGNWDIYVIPVVGGVARQLTAEVSEDSRPSWSRDGHWVYFGSNRTGRMEVWKVPSGGGTAVQVTKNGGYKPVESPNGKFIYYNKGQSFYDAWRIPVGGGEETPVLENLQSRWELAEGGLYLFEQEPDGRWFLKFFDFATRWKKPVAALPGTPVVGQNPTVSPDGQTFLYVQSDIGEADLVLVENFR